MVGVGEVNDPVKPVKKPSCEISNSVDPLWLCGPIMHLGGPIMAGPWESVMEKSSFTQLLLLNLHGKLVLPKCLMSEWLFAVSLVLLSALAPGYGVLLVSSSAGNIWWKVLSGRLFPWAPVSTFAFRMCSPGRPVTLILRDTNTSSQWLWLLPTLSHWMTSMVSTVMFSKLSTRSGSSLLWFWMECTLWFLPNCPACPWFPDSLRPYWFRLLDLFLLWDCCTCRCCAGCLLPLRHMDCQWPVRPQL